MIPIKNRIKKIRKELDLTQQEFASRIGTTANVLTNYETGRRNPSSSVINNICKTFNINENWLRRGEGEMFISINMENQLTEWAGKVFGEKEESFKKRFVTMLMSLNEREWELLEEKAKQLVEEPKKNKISEEAATLEPVTVEQAETEYIKSRLEIVQQEGSSVSSTTTEKRRNKAANQ